MLPNFLLIGAPKAGSSSLHSYLRSHPQVFMPALKEPDYFVETRNWPRGRAWYEDLFSPGGDALARGEASVLYTTHPFHPGVPERTASVVPDVKLIYLMRHPIERMVSQYMHNAEHYGERRPIGEALLHTHYLQLSRYATQIGRYLEWFPRDRMLVLTSEELRGDRAATMRRVFAFLGVDPSPAENLASAPEVNRTPARPVPRRTTHVLMGMRGARRLRALLPARIVQAGRRATHAPAPELSRKVEGQLAALLHDDVAGVRAYLPPDFDGWGIA